MEINAREAELEEPEWASGSSWTFRERTKDDPPQPGDPGWMHTWRPLYPGDPGYDGSLPVRVLSRAADTPTRFADLSEFARKLVEHQHGPQDEDSLWRFDSGEAIRTPDAAADDPFPLLNLVDLGEVMRIGVTAPEMLVDDLLVANEHQSWYGNKESAKTWLALWAAAQLLRRGETVVWVDKEMNRINVADRFKALGVAPEAVSTHLAFAEFPPMDGSKASVEQWRAMLALRRPRLVVVDAQTEVLADAGLNENVGTDIEKWSSWYLTPARQLPAATLVLDHTGHDEKGRARGSGHKGAAAKVELAFVKRAKFDRETLGSVEVRLNKNTVAAPITETQWYRLGGDGQGGFVLERQELPPHTDSASASAAVRDRMKQAVIERLIDAGEIGLTRTQLDGMVTGKSATLRDVLAELAEDANSGVVARQGRREGSLLYVFEGGTASDDL